MYIEVTELTGLRSTCGNYYNYQLITGGSTPTELMENAFIVEIDENGNEGTCNELSKYDDTLFRRCAVIVAKHWVNSEIQREAA